MPDTRDSLVALLMAGGSGTRLWPLSRTGRAKQFSALLAGSEKTMLEMTYDRVRSLVPPERVFVNVTAGNEHWVEKILRDVPRANVISAPADRDTLPTLGFATLAIERAVKNPTMLLLASDNWVGDDAALARFLREGASVAESGPYLVSIGIRPDHPSVHYGYMKRGAHVFGEATYTGLGYHEKPDASRAKEYVDDGSYDWNSGMFVWTAATFWDAVRTHAPRDAAVFEELRAVEGADKDRVSTLFARLSRIAVDHGVLEHVSEKTRVQHRFVRAKVPWDDVGRYTALANHLVDAGSGNRTRGNATIVNASDTIAIASEGRSVTITGVSDVIVCADGDDVLVCKRAADGRVRDLADEAAWPGVVRNGEGALTRNDIDENGNRLHGFVKVLDAEKCVVDGDSRGVVALVAVTDIRVDVRGNAVRVSAVTEKSPARATATTLLASPRVFVDEDRASMSRRAARAILDTLVETAKNKPNPVVVLSAGATPERVYALFRGPLRDALDWSPFTLLQMDDYAGMSPEDSSSFADFLRRELVVPLGIGKFLSLSGESSNAEITKHELVASERGIDLIVHGIGENGHLGFNEPGTSFDSAARVVDLAPETRAAAAAASGGFGGLEKVPARGVTLGLRVLNSARRVFVLASGEKKAAAIGAAFLKPKNTECPASSLQAHADVTLFLDRGAAARFYA